MEAERPALPCSLPSWVEFGVGPSMIRTICAIIWVAEAHLVGPT